MADTTTTAKGLTKPAIGSHDATWGDVINADLDLIDAAIGGSVAISISGDVSVNSTQAENLIYKFTGSLSGNATITFPAFRGLAVISNGCTGGSLVCGSGGTTVTVGAGDTATAWSDGTDFKAAAPTAGVWSTGDTKITLKTVADAGWVMFNDGNIGDASSGATTRANADTSALFALLWNNTANADCAVSTGRGVSAAADFAAHKTIALPKVLGRALAVAGAGSGLTSRALAHVVGEETHLLTIPEMPGHTHTIQSANVTTGSDSQVVSAAATGSPNNTPGTTSTGGGGTHNNMQPTTFFNIMVKL